MGLFEIMLDIKPEQIRELKKMKEMYPLMKAVVDASFAYRDAVNSKPHAIKGKNGVLVLASGGDKEGAKKRWELSLSALEKAVEENNDQ